MRRYSNAVHEDYLVQMCRGLVAEMDKRERGAYYRMNGKLRPALRKKLDAILKKAAELNASPPLPTESDSNESAD